MRWISRFTALFALTAALCAALWLVPRGVSAQAGQRQPAGGSPPAQSDCSGGPMWASIGHPGLGEMINSGRGWNGLPKRKFWLGFIPGFGWPGYLQVVSAIDASKCRTNDWPNE
jgi:hypothetical protein